MEDSAGLRDSAPPILFRVVRDKVCATNCARAKEGDVGTMYRAPTETGNVCAVNRARTKEGGWIVRVPKEGDVGTMNRALLRRLVMA